MKLYRACSYEEAYWTVERKSVGGVVKVEFDDMKAPTEEEVQSYVSKHEGFVGIYKEVSGQDLPNPPGEPSNQRELAEYTTNYAVARAFAKSTGWMVECECPPYLLTYFAKSSGVEDGYLARVGTHIIKVGMVVRNGKDMRKNTGFGAGDRVKSWKRHSSYFRQQEGSIVQEEQSGKSEGKEEHGGSGCKLHG